MWDCIHNVTAHAELFVGSMPAGWLGRGSVGGDPEASGRCLTAHHTEHISYATQEDTGRAGRTFPAGLVTGVQASENLYSGLSMAIPLISSLVPGS